MKPLVLMGAGVLFCSLLAGLVVLLGAPVAAVPLSIAACACGWGFGTELAYKR